MSLYIDKKFVSLVSPKLERFKQKSEYLWTFRCPICGDSHKNKLKTRGYFYRRKSDLFYTCHNCGTSLSVGNFLKAIDPSLYREYQLERYKNESTGNVAKPDFSIAKTKPVFATRIDLPTIASLSDNHPAKAYLLKRKLPADRLSDIYYADDFSAFVKDIHPDYDKTLYKEQRIIFPFYDEKKNLLGFQGRAVGDSKIKYITVKLNDDNKKVFGLDRVDFSKKVYVVEGPIDSLFLQNSLATMDASLSNIITLLGNHDYVFIHDNECRNSAIVKQMEKTISKNKNIFIWPQDVAAKDINDWILTGTTPAEIQSLIDTNTFNSLRAKLEFERWRKI
jgi:predicted RNA-binding Zn-ribbon protein involved in translation (DUF1610 family)